MKRFSFRLFLWWFALTAPTRTSMSTLAEREYERKRRLLSLLLLLDLTVSLIATALESFSLLHMPLVFAWSAIFLFCFAFWLNRRGALHLAALICLLNAGTLVFLSVQVLSLSHATALLWGLPELVFYLAMAGLLLPAWMIWLLAVLEHLVFYWYLFVVCYDRLLQVISPQELQSFFVYLSLWIYFCAFIGVTYAVTTKRAVKQADRAVELEQAHRTISEAYTCLEEAHATIQKQALTDALTGLPNHRAVMDQFTKELERAGRYGRPLSLLFFDADRFKRVNDTYGHTAGDAVLHQIGERAGKVLRGGDTIGRFGGEEFVILLPEADVREASVVAERIRTTVAAEPVAACEVEGGIVTTVSIGLATYPDDGDSEQVLLSQADQAMYVAKRLGRNQVRTAEQARTMSADLEWMALFQEEGQREAMQREGIAPEQLRETYTLRIVCSLLSLLEGRDQQMSAHAYAVSDLATALAHEMGLEAKDVTRIGLAALLHDIGKVAIPDRLLQKASLLSSAEHALLQEHAALGAQILEANPFLSDLMPAVQHHHERWDGDGYPDGLRGVDIPLPARIIAVAEAYDAMQRDYPYRARRFPEEALAEVQHGAGVQFDPAVVQALSTVLANQGSQQQSLQVVS
jgi:diguanylate cyclase (GGDEF)-like protein/putative nucleotidyltransferase with HDIG domain